MVGLTKSNIAKLIEHPENFSEDQLSSLKNLAKQYPFSGLINSLLTKAYHLSNDIEYHSQLEKAAFTISDRLVLYKYIHRPALLEKIKSVIHDNEQDSSQPPLKNDDPQLLELEKNILSAAINLSIQKEVEVNNDKTKQNIEPSSKNIEIDFSKKEMPLLSWLKPLNEQTDKKNKLASDQLIENYISGKENKEKKPFFSPIESAKLSLVDNEEFVTETLAEIHVKQGNYPKAIQIYEKLILKFPEKNVFFASRIRFIQEKSNYK
jgi:hypothetical protein